MLNELDYRVHEIHLSEAMDRLDWDEPLIAEPVDEHIWSYMSAGDKLCSPECWDRADAFGLLAAHGIALKRQEISGDIDVPADREAYVLRSLKRPEEVELLRNVYGSRFVLIAAYSPASRRRAYLRTGSRRVGSSHTRPSRRHSR